MVYRLSNYKRPSREDRTGESRTSASSMFLTISVCSLIERKYLHDLITSEKYKIRAENVLKVLEEWLQFVIYRTSARKLLFSSPTFGRQAHGLCYYKSLLRARNVRQDLREQFPSTVKTFAALLGRGRRGGGFVVVGFFSPSLAAK